MNQPTTTAMKMTFGSEGLVTYSRIKPTGRWCLESSVDYENKMFIECKWWIFKYWVPEDRIVFFDYELNRRIFDCTT